MGVFSELKPVNHAPRNGFDLGRFTTFSSKVGPIQCVFNQLTEPSSEYELDIQQLCRTAPLQQAAFAGFTINYDVVWTPLNLLYSSFNQFIAQRECKNLAFQPSYQYIPKINLGEFVMAVLRYAFVDYVHSFCPESYFLSSSSPAYAIPYRLVTSEQSPNRSVYLEVIRHLDMFGYGNFLPVLKTMLTAFKRYFPDYDLSDPAVQRKISNMWSGQQDLQARTVFDLQSYDTWFGHFFFDLHDGNFNGLIDLESVLASLDSSRVGSTDKKCTLWPVLAYNKAFYEYYRNSYYDNKYRLYVYSYSDSTPTSPFMDEYPYDYVSLFNFDDYNPQMDTNILGHQDDLFTRFLAMFMVKPHLYKRDLFTGVLPSTQFGDVSVMVSQPEWFKLYYKDVSIGENGNPVGRARTASNTALSPLYSSGDPVTNTANSKVGSAQFSISPQLAISVLESRRADAMQRFRERMLRAGDNVKDIFKAHGWSEPLSEKSYEPIFLGSYDGRIDINTVAVTGSAGDYNVGELAANGVGVVRGQKCRIKTSDFGVLAVYFYISKDAIYNAYGVERQHCLTDPFDFPYPELQNISLKPIVRGELAAIGYNEDRSDHFNDILGYLPADMCFKTAIDKVHGEFFSGGHFTGSPVAYALSGVFSDWVTPRHDYEHATELSFLYIDPSCADRIFAQAATDNQDSDQFKVNCRFDCYAVEPNTVIGLPI